MDCSGMLIKTTTLKYSTIKICFPVSTADCSTAPASACIKSLYGHKVHSLLLLCAVPPNCSQQSLQLGTINFVFKHTNAHFKVDILIVDSKQLVHRDGRRGSTLSTVQHARNKV